MKMKEIGLRGGASLANTPMIMHRGKDQRKYLTFVIAARSGRKKIGKKIDEFIVTGKLEKLEKVTIVYLFYLFGL